MATTTAREMAKQFGVDPKIFREALREEKFPWHHRHARWIVEIDSPRHAGLQRVLRKLSN